MGKVCPDTREQRPLSFSSSFSENDNENDERKARARRQLEAWGWQESEALRWNRLLAPANLDRTETAISAVLAYIEGHPALSVPAVFTRAWEKRWAPSPTPSMRAAAERRREFEAQAAADKARRETIRADVRGEAAREGQAASILAALKPDRRAELEALARTRADSSFPFWMMEEAAKVGKLPANSRDALDFWRAYGKSIKAFREYVYPRILDSLAIQNRAEAELSIFGESTDSSGKAQGTGVAPTSNGAPPLL